jgi:GTPase SAR1 family protein
LTKELNGKQYEVEFWDTAGQERYNSVHRTYYIGAHCCILVFDCKVQDSYKHLTKWYDELCSLRPGIPCLVAVNKIDTNPSAVEMEFKFATKRGFPVHYVSALDGTNVIPLFDQAIALAKECQDNPPKDDIVGAVEEYLREFREDPKETPAEGDGAAAAPAATS